VPLESAGQTLVCPGVTDVSATAVPDMVITVKENSSNLVLEDGGVKGYVVPVDVIWPRVTTRIATRPPVSATARRTTTNRPTRPLASPAIATPLEASVEPAIR